MKTFYAIIPMKAHSERVPDKNIRVFNGKPLFYSVFKTLNEVKSISKIILDTDSDNIAEQVLTYFPKTEISIRPERLRGDFVSTNLLIEHILSLYPDQNYFLQTHTTNPCLRADTVRNAISVFLREKEFDSLFTVTRLQTRLFKKDFSPLNHDPYNLIRTQDLDPVYEENSSLYLFTRASFIKTAARIGEHPFLLEMNSLEAFDIDTKEDFILAELLQKTLKTNSA